MEEGARELEDWEMLQITETGLAPASDDKSSSLDGLGTGSERAIRLDYFALDSEGQYGKKASQEDQEHGSLGSDDSSGIDPHSKPQNEVDPKGDLGFGGIENASGNSSISGLGLRDDGSVPRSSGVFEGKNELGCGVDVKNDVGFEGFGETEKIKSERENFIELWLEDLDSEDANMRGIGKQKELGFKDDDAEAVNFEGTEMEGKNSEEFMLDSGGNELFSGKFEGVEDKDKTNDADLPKMGDGSESSGIMEFGGDSMDSAALVEGGVEFPSGGDGAEVNLRDEEKKEAVWYKLPLDLLKFCVFRISPVWSISIAAAVVGFVILKRRLYNMNHKNRSIPLKVSMDEKKVSQVKVRVACINEAFLVVKRVPIIRSSLPGTAGVSPWPVI